MKQWIKLESDLLQDARIVRLVEDLGMKGLGAYICIRLSLEKYGEVLSVNSICHLLKDVTRNRLIIDVLTKYDLFDVLDSFVRVRIPADTPADTPADRPADGCAPVPIVSIETNKYREIEEEKEFHAQMATNYPSVMALKKPLRKIEFDKVVMKYGLPTTVRTIREMENYRNLNKKYVSAYLTLLNWCEPK